MRSWIWGLSAALVVWHAAVAEEPVRDEALEIETRPGVTTAFYLSRPATPPVAAAILFTGGEGSIGIHPGETVEDPVPFGKGNFLVRTRRLLAANGILVATVDPPSDQDGTLNPVFRLSADHAADVGRLALWLKDQGGGPVWLVGTSMGTLSAANAAVRLGAQVDGLLLTSTITVGNRHLPYPYNGVLSLDLEELSIPVLVMAHGEDGCWATPPANGERLLARLEKSPRKALVLIHRGAPAQSGPCQARAAHGYFGREEEAVAAMAAFITGADRPAGPGPQER
jgi:pimeloyl-ACP methyl ester carboxylesterase